TPIGPLTIALVLLLATWAGAVEFSGRVVGVTEATRSRCWWRARRWRGVCEASTPRRNATGVLDAASSRRTRSAGRRITS
ncbi:MAG: hypothetical protein ACYSX0_20920, partial [Planctomycetota bacterium]